MSGAEALSFNRVDGGSLLLERAEAAARQKNEDEARRLFKAALRHDPTNDQALLWMVYLAKDGQESLNYLAQLLDAHPRHPQAREAVRWARRRTPTSPPRQLGWSGSRVPAFSRQPIRLVAGLVLVAALIGLGALWTIARSPAAPAQAGAAPTQPPSAFPTPTPRPLIEIIQILIPVFTLTPTPTPVPTPSTAWVSVEGHPQTYNMSCESRSAADLAGYWGISVHESSFLAAMGTSDNPHEGFVGDIHAPPGSLPPYGYGVYAEPVAATLRDYGLDARPTYDLGLDRLRAELTAGRPVLVWATYGMALYNPREWTSQDGRVSTVVPFMHTFLVIGFDEGGVFVIDALDATVQYFSFQAFLSAWDLFDQMTVLVHGPLS